MPPGIPDGPLKGEARAEQSRLLQRGGSDAKVYDVLIAGAGPAGATCAYYARAISDPRTADPSLPPDPAPAKPLSVGLLDKARFPRDKYCGDAWCALALDLLEEMNVLQDIEREGLFVDTLAGGFVSPAGHSFIVNDRAAAEAGGAKNMETRCYAIKRMICDERIVRRAQQTGVELHEEALVERAELVCSQDDPSDRLWLVACKDGRKFQARVLVCADGAASNLARTLGIVTDAPSGVACRQYIKGGTHNFKADGVLLYPEYTLPGYVALFRHYDDSIDVGAYLLPGGTAKEEDIAQIYEEKIKTDPFVSRALGEHAVPLERVKVASLRLGGVARSYDDHVLVVGDAAGQVDGLTGEGIHTGMLGGKLAAATIVEMFQQGNFGAQHGGKLYHKRWMQAFGHDFPLSSAAGKVVFRAPFLMDAVPIAARGKGGKAGSDFFADFGAVMTGVKPKSTFLLRGLHGPLRERRLASF